MTVNTKLPAWQAHFENDTAAFANRLAADFGSAIIIRVADVLQQVWHFRERTPFSIGGKALVPCALVRRSFCICIHKSKIRDTKQISEPGEPHKTPANKGSPRGGIGRRARFRF